MKPAPPVTRYEDIGDAGSTGPGLLRETGLPGNGPAGHRTRPTTSTLRSWRAEAPRKKGSDCPTPVEDENAAASRKPNSVPPSPLALAGLGLRRMTTIPLAPPSLAGSSDLPGGFRRAALKRLPIWSCSVRGFACHRCCHRRGALLPHLFTLTPAPRALKGPRYSGRAALFRPPSGAVYFLCHCPSGHPDRALPGALPCGVRTFLLSRRALRRSGRAAVWFTAAHPLYGYFRAGARRASRPTPARSGTVRASCTDCCGACRSPQRSSRYSSRSRAASRRGTRARRSP